MPSYRRAYRDLVARGLAEHEEDEPMVCCDFSDQAIDAVGGRYYFSLVRDLIDAGFFPIFTARRGTLSTFGTSRMKSLLLKERLGVVTSLAQIPGPFHLITDGKGPWPDSVLKVITVDYEHRLCRDESEVAFPVFVHPQITTRTRFPYPYEVGKSRPVRLFFGGNTEEEKYGSKTLGAIYGMLNRREMLAAIPGETHRPKDANEWLDSDIPYSFVLCETQHCKIPRDRWVEALAKADFFLACPGVGMPLCHNLIEAMAAGAIPVLQYADYLPDPLEDGVDCLAFRDAEELRVLATRIFAMDAEEICRMRAEVQKFYHEFLAPGRFTHSLFFERAERKTLLINAYRVPRS